MERLPSLPFPATHETFRPAKRPDFDNIGKIIADALNGVAYRDDAQIVEAKLVKIYVDGPGATSVTIGTVGKED